MTARKRPGQKTELSEAGGRSVRRRWRDYKTASGRSPVEEFIEELSNTDAAAVLSGMQEVRDLGLGAARRRLWQRWQSPRSTRLRSFRSASARRVPRLA
jgi:hypothetical protein